MPEGDTASRDKINLRLLLVDGSTHEFPFATTTTASAIADHIYHHWPSEWTARNSVQKPDKPEVLRLIYRGRFLHGTLALSSLGLPKGKTTIMHMVIRDRLPEEPSTDSSHSRRKATTRRADSQSSCCTIL